MLNILRCDAGWTGTECEQTTLKLPQYMYDMYTEVGESSYLIAGGKLTKPCKTMASGLALHFTGVSFYDLKMKCL